MRVIVMVAMIAGCFHPTVATDVPCGSDGSCPLGQHCDFGTAPPRCTAMAGDLGDARLESDGTVDMRVDGFVRLDAADLDAPIVPPVPIAFVQGAATKPTLATSTFALPDPIGATDAIIVCLNFDGGTTTLQSVTDSLGNPYSIVFGPETSSGDTHYIAIASNSPAGAATLTLTFSAAPTGADLLVTEYAGLALTNPFDASAYATGTTTTMDSGVASGTTDNELLLGYAEAPSASAAAGYIARASVSGNMVEDKISAAVGAHHAAATTTAGAWTMILAVFKGR